MVEQRRWQRSFARRTTVTSWAIAGFLLAGCSTSVAPWASVQPVDGGLPDLPLLENPRTHDDKFEVRVLGRTLPHLAGHITQVDAGPRTLLVVYTEASESEGAAQPIALWLRGRGSSRHRLPQFSSGLVNPGNRQDWDVDLPPGDYLLSVTLGPGSPSAAAHLVVR